MKHINQYPTKIFEIHIDRDETQYHTVAPTVTTAAPRAFTVATAINRIYIYR